MSVSIPGILVALLIYFTVPEPTRHGRITKTGTVPVKDVLRFVWAHRAIYVPMLLSLGIVAIPLYGLDAWRPTFMERTFGWGPAAVGSVLGVAGLAAGPLGLYLGTMISEYLDRTGHADAMLRSVMIAQLLSIPFVIAGPLLSNPWLSIIVSMLGVTGYWMGAPGQNAALQIITPNEMRGQLSAVYLYLLSAIGGGVGPTFVALITDHVLHNESQLRYAMAATGVVVCPVALLLIWLSMKPYGEAVRRVTARGVVAS
jgi:MFS family permease